MQHESATNPIAAVVGGLPLEPEESTNYSVGFVSDGSDRLNITIG